MSRMALIGCIVCCVLPNRCEAQPPSFVDLGFISATSLNYQNPDFRLNNIHINPQQVLWYRFRLGQQVLNSNGKWLDLDLTPGVDGNGVPIDGRQGVDTQMVLYNAAGNRVSVVDDDSGVLFYSQLSFGQTSPVRGPFDMQGYPLNSPGDGRDGDLLDNNYFVAVVLNDFASQNVFGDTNFNVISASTDSADFALEFRTNVTAVPEPAMIVLIGSAGGLVGWSVFRRYRRRVRQLEVEVEPAPVE